MAILSWYNMLLGLLHFTIGTVAQDNWPDEETFLRAGRVRGACHC